MSTSFSGYSRIMAAALAFTQFLPAIFSPAIFLPEAKAADTASENNAVKIAQLAPVVLNPGNEPLRQKQLPAELADNHEANKILSVGPFHIHSLVRIASLKPIKLDAVYTEPIDLKTALSYALNNSLPIKISQQSWYYQRYQMLGALAGAVPIPNMNMSYNIVHSDVEPNTASQNSLVFQTTFRYPVFQGGATVYGFLAQYYRQRGWKQAYYTSRNDALLDVYQKYSNLVLQHALLQIKAKSLEVSEAQLKLNNALFSAGTGTKFAIMQSRTQLAADRQAMLQQQVSVRQAALALAFALNLPMAINLAPLDEFIKEDSIIDESLPINTLISATLDHRPELRQYEMFRLAAARSVQQAAAALYPQASFFTAITNSQTVVHPRDGDVGGIAVAQLNSFLTNNGTASNNALGQTASFSPTASTSANTGVNNTVATSVVAASGGTPLNVVQSGSIVTSGAAAPGFAGGNGGQGSANINGSNTVGAGVFPGLFSTFQAGFSMNWALNSMGLNTLTNIVSARTLSRQALMQCNQELLLVTQQVRADYLAALTNRKQIDTAAQGAASAREALRLAELRLQTGTGTNLELIQAQRDYINALSMQAQAIINSNIAQAQLLHDMGVISIDTLTNGYIADSKPLSKSKKKAKSKI